MAAYGYEDVNTFFDSTSDYGKYRIELGNNLIDVIIAYNAQYCAGFVKRSNNTWVASTEYNIYTRTRATLNDAYSKWGAIAGNEHTAAVKNEFLSFTPIPNTYWRLEAVGKTSSLYSNTGYKSIIVPVREGDKFIITAEGDGYARTWGTLDENKVVLRYAERYPQTNAEVTIASGECYLVVNCETRMLWDVRITSTAADILQQFIAAEDRATEKGRKLALRNLFVRAGALYNDTSADITRTAPWGESVTHKVGCYYLNGIGDLTEEEMTVIYNEKDRLLTLEKERRCQEITSIRSFFVPAHNNTISSFYDIHPRLQFQSCLMLEVLSFNRGRFKGVNNDVVTASYICVLGNSDRTDASFIFGNCKKLKYISALNVTHIKSFGTGSNGAFYNCSALLGLYLYKLNTSIELAQSADILQESILYMIENATPTTAITITLHADAYARLENDAEIVAALEAQPLVTLVSA